MPLLDIAAAQPAFQSHLCMHRAQICSHGKLSSTSLTLANEKRLSCAWKSLGLAKELFFSVKNLEVRRGRLRINAVATLETKGLVQNENGPKGYDVSQVGANSSLPTIQLVEDSNELGERERLRRMRISKANKGNTPWNKGRKHSAETLQRIKERTKLAMQDPKVKMKLMNLGHAQSKETRMKIAVGVRMGWQRRRERLMVQENCYFEWQNLIAEASRRGFFGEVELQWDSYKILNEQLKQEWVESVEQRKMMERPKGSKRAPKSLEQRRKIAEAISAKWADPDYRNRVCSGLAKYHGIEPGAERKSRRRPSDGTRMSKRSPMKKEDSDTSNSSEGEAKIQNKRSRLRRNSAPLYKDPLVSSKLEMIKNIRAKRAVVETKKMEAIERARLLIAEAEKAAKALEIAATKSPIARASLMETRKLIAEAIQSIESIETGQISSHENGSFPSIASDDLISQVDKDSSAKIEVLNHADLREVNGTPIVPSKDDNFNFSKFTLHELLNNEEELLPSSFSGSGTSPFGFDSLMKQSCSRNDLNQAEPNGYGECRKDPQLNGTEVESLKEETPKLVPVTKKWVRGRLIEVAEEA
ncbi:uncharacterized protein LOC115991516 isoform X2 [Quercus lobata]|uniref:Nuclease associated modular domain-containing protein n=1 Tax=Quercus lobata TaxID=97700 RepID=A0A7N2LLF7_QUELO|nr:uncharacterized protein LOC115991516 isoform X2 [Quercus lobata]